MVIHYNSCCAYFSLFLLLCLSPTLLPLHSEHDFCLPLSMRKRSESGAYIASRVESKKNANTRELSALQLLRLLFGLCAVIIDGIRYVALYRCHGNCHLVNLLSCHYYVAADAGAARMAMMVVVMMVQC